MQPSQGPCSFHQPLKAGEQRSNQGQNPKLREGTVVRIQACLPAHPPPARMVPPKPSTTSSAPQSSCILKSGQTHLQGWKPHICQRLSQIFPVTGNEKHLARPNCTVRLHEIYRIWKPLRNSLSLFQART